MIARTLSRHTQETKFVETSTQGGEPEKYVVTFRPKTEAEQFNNRSGKLVSSLDSRICLAVGKGTFRLKTKCTLRVSTLLCANTNM